MASLVMTGAGDNSATTVDLDDATTFPNKQTWYKPTDNITGNITTNDAVRRTAGSFTISAPSNIMWTPGNTGFLTNNALVKKSLTFSGTAIGTPGGTSGTDSTCVYTSNTGETIVLTYPIDAAGVTTVNVFCGAFLSGGFTCKAHVSDGSSADVTQTATGGDNPNNFVIACQANGSATLTITLTNSGAGFMYFSGAALSTSVASGGGGSPAVDAPVYRGALTSRRSPDQAQNLHTLFRSVFQPGETWRPPPRVRHQALDLPAYELPPPTVQAHVIDVHINADPDGATNTNTISVTRFVKPGSAIHVYATWDNTSGASTASCADNVNGSYGATLDQVGTTTQFLAQWSKLAAAGGLTTITVTTSTACVLKAIWVQEIAGASALQVHGGQSQAAPGTGADAVTSGNLTPTSVPSLLVGLCSNTDVGTLVAGTGMIGGPFGWHVIKAARSVSQRVTSSPPVAAATFTTSNGTGAYRTLAAVYTDAPAGQLPDIVYAPARQYLARQPWRHDQVLPVSVAGTVASVNSDPMPRAAAPTPDRPPEQLPLSLASGPVLLPVSDRGPRPRGHSVDVETQVPTPAVVASGTGLPEASAAARAIPRPRITVEGPIPSSTFVAMGTGIPDTVLPARRVQTPTPAIADQLLAPEFQVAIAAEAWARPPARVQIAVDAPIPQPFAIASGAGIASSDPVPRGPGVRAALPSEDLPVALVSAISEAFPTLARNTVRLMVDAALPEIFGVAAGSAIVDVMPPWRAWAVARAAVSGDAVISIVPLPVMAEPTRPGLSHARALPDAAISATVAQVVLGLVDTGMAQVVPWTRPRSSPLLLPQQLATVVLKIADSPPAFRAALSLRAADGYPIALPPIGGNWIEDARAWARPVPTRQPDNAQAAISSLVALAIDGTATTSARGGRRIFDSGASLVALLGAIVDAQPLARAARPRSPVSVEVVPALVVSGPIVDADVRAIRRSVGRVVEAAAIPPAAAPAIFDAVALRVIGARARTSADASVLGVLKSPLGTILDAEPMRYPARFPRTPFIDEFLPRPAFSGVLLVARRGQFLLVRSTWKPTRAKKV